MVLSTASCVSNKASYRGDWERHTEVEEPYFVMYLIGDAGKAADEANTYLFDHLKNQLDAESPESAIVWLGDNIYPVGLAPPTNIYHAEGRRHLLAQLQSMSDFQGYKYFVPGNHDWYTYGRIGLRRQEMLVDSFLSHTPNPNEQINFFIPDKGCGDPQVHELMDGISVLLMDSHWFLNEKARIGDQEVCEVRTPEQYIDQLQSEIKSQQDKSLIVVSHHPPYTYAHHGGKFPLKDDLFPITQKVDWFYWPLPVTGFVFNRIRLRFSEQDVYHPLYKAYKSALVEALEDTGVSIVASGHEHTLQYIERHNQHFIVSGAGSKQNKVAMGRGSKFAIGMKGYAKLIFRDSKNVVVQFIVPGQYEEYENVAYEKLLELK